MVKEVPLTKGYVALVDDADFEFVSQFKWSVIEANSRKQLYARRGVVIDGDWFHITMHRLLTGCPEGVTVDHWNGDGLDNRRENLRLCSRRQNQANSRPKSGRPYKGVHSRSANCYKALIQFKEHRWQLGNYKTAAEAAKVYDAAARRIYGEFALLNFDQIDPAADEIAARVLAGGDPPEWDFDRKTKRSVTDEQVIEIRRRYAAGGIKQDELAAEFGLKRSMVNHIITGRTFKDVGELVPKERRRELHSIHCRKEQAA